MHCMCTVLWKWILRQKFLKAKHKSLRKIFSIVVPTTLVCAIFLYCIDSFQTYYYPNFVMSNLRKSGNIYNLLKTSTPLSAKYLWRPDSLDADSRNKDDRILDQFGWMKEYSNSSALKNKTKRRKKIMVFNSDHSYYNTDNKLICPGFDFNYCDITLSTQVKRPTKSMGGYDAVISTQDWGRQAQLWVPRRTKQIIYILESPKNARANLTKNNAILASYHRGSDITIPYGKWIPFKHGRKHSASANIPDVRNFADGKTGLAVIFVSNCYANNDRLSYVRELQKLIAVDIFGSCANDTNFDTKCEGADRNNCMKNVIRKYKFYLAFENSNCRDYITEKFYRNALEYSAVPVVLGAHPEDYKESAPPQSYINVEDFESPLELAQYLKMLDCNDALYNEYFRWRDTGELYFSWKHFFCQVCGMLYYADYVPPPKWKPNSTWSSVSTCLPNHQWYWLPRN